MYSFSVFKNSRTNLISSEAIICSELIDDGLESDKNGNESALVALILSHSN